MGMVTGLLAGGSGPLPLATPMERKLPELVARVRRSVEGWPYQEGVEPNQHHGAEEAVLLRPRPRR